MKRSLLHSPAMYWLFVMALVCMGCLQSPLAAAVEWPQELSGENGTVIIYQPQPDELNGNTLIARAAMSIEMNDGSDPIFGAVWLSSTIETDRAQDIAMIRNIKVTRATWPDSKDTGEQRFQQFVDEALQNSELTISLSALKASLAVSDKARQSLEDLNNDPPVIRFEQELAILLMYDGKPRFSPIDNTDYERALNTPLAVARSKRGGKVYLTSGSLWYVAGDAQGPFAHTTQPPSELVAMIPKSDDPVPTAIPKVVVATEPTELVVSQGKPNWVSLEGGNLLYVDNTETPWLRDLATGNMYIQLSGRWYRSKNEAGPWVFVRSDKLPEAFAAIPPASDIGGVRSSVSGTPEAEEAMADAAIPQTAAIKRSEASLTVDYDGTPKFEAIKGTEVAYAVNTAAQVLRIDGSFYAVDEGVWFTAKSATGPWVVADTIPSDKIAEIPPSSPVYNTTYVHIYDSSPEVVYVGYTPGYMWSFPYYGVPVYGTGWYYPPYWGGGYYYPRTPTWGFHVGYNPWTGWNFGVSWGGPFLRVGVSWGGGYYGRPGCCGGWYGGGYRHNDININTGDINIGNNVNIGNRRNDLTSIKRDNSRTNLYNNARNRDRVSDPALARENLRNARPSKDRKNDLFADKQGQVARRNGDDWEVRQNRNWEKAADVERQGQLRDSKPSTGAADKMRDFDRPQTQQVDRSRMPARPQVNHQRMNREFNARQRGSAMGGGMRGSGMRRR